MSAVILIAGTNCTGKTTLAKALIEHFGGVQYYYNNITVCTNKKPRVAFIGKYSDGKYGGGGWLK